MNIIDEFFYKYTEQFKLTMKAMVNGQLTKAEAAVLDTLREDDCAITQVYLGQKPTTSNEYTEGINEFFSKHIPGDIRSQLKFYNDVHKFILKHAGTVDKIELYSLLYQLHIVGFNLFHPVSPLGISKSNLILPSFLSKGDDVGGFEKPMEGLDRISVDLDLPDLFEFIYLTPELTKVMERLESWFEPSKLSEIANRYGAISLNNIRDSFSDIANVDNGIFSHIDYRVLMMLKYLDELIYSLES